MEPVMAIFIQQIKEHAPFGLCTLDQAMDAFWVVSGDLKVAFGQQKPECWDDVNELLRTIYMPQLAITLREHGIRIIELEEKP